MLHNDHNINGPGAGGFVVGVDLNNIGHLRRQPELVLKGDAGVVSNSFPSLTDVLSLNNLSGVQKALEEWTGDY